MHGPLLRKQAGKFIVQVIGTRWVTPSIVRSTLFVNCTPAPRFEILKVYVFFGHMAVFYI